MAMNFNDNLMVMRMMMMMMMMMINMMNNVMKKMVDMNFNDKIIIIIMNNK